MHSVIKIYAVYTAAMPFLLIEGIHSVGVALIFLKENGKAKGRAAHGALHHTVRLPHEVHC